MIVFSGTLFCDLDGSLVKHNYDPLGQEDEWLPGAEDFLRRLLNANNEIIITTARSKDEIESFKKILFKSGIYVHRFIFDLSSGPRYLVNDKKNPFNDTAYAINLIRNEGFPPIKAEVEVD